MKPCNVCASAGFLLATLAAGTTYAQDAEFILANNTQFSVYHVYFWPVTTDGPGPDRLGRMTIPSGQRIKFSPRDDECSYNICVGLANSEFEEWNNVNLCNLSSVTLNYDNLRQEVWASMSTSSFPDSARRTERDWDLVGREHSR